MSFYHFNFSSQLQVDFAPPSKLRPKPPGLLNNAILFHDPNIWEDTMFSLVEIASPIVESRSLPNPPISTRTPSGVALLLVLWEKQTSLNSIKQLRLKDPRYKRDRLAQMAFLTIETLVPPMTTTQGQGFYIEIFLIDPPTFF